MVGVVYQISIGPKKQIGSTGRVESRMKEHLTALERGVHCNKYMQNAYNKYGCFAYEILSIHSTRLEAYLEEQILINRFYGVQNYTMMNPTATRPPVKLGLENSFSKEETKRKLLETKKQRGSLSRSESTRSKISEANRGRVQPKEEVENREVVLIEARKTLSYKEAHKKGCIEGHIKKSTAAKAKSTKLFRECNPSYKVQTCVHCNRSIQGVSAFKRFHNDNCKLKTQ